MIRVKVVKVARAGFGDFLVETGVSRLTGKCDDNKEVCIVDKICDCAGHKYNDCEH